MKRDQVIAVLRAHERELRYRGVRHAALFGSVARRAVLRAHERELRYRGVRHAALFGSVARDAARRTSDIDILIEIEPEAQIGVFEYVGITQYLEDLFPKADVANRATLKPEVRPSAERDAVYAF